MPSRMVIPNLKAPRDPTFRNDMEKTGFFIDMGILRPQLPYMDFEKAAEFRSNGRHGKQMLSRGPKIRAALRDCYFDKEERRIFIGNGISDPVKLRHQAGLASRKLDVDGRWVPGRGRMDPCGKNTFYGTFAGRVDALSAALRPRPPRDPYHPDFVAVYPKSGSFGWTWFTLSKYPEHLPEPYDGDRVDRDVVDKIAGNENTLRMNRKAFLSAGKQGVLYFDKNPYLVENPPAEPEGKPVKPKPAFENGSAFRPSGRPKPMKRMKHWGTFNKLEDLGGNYVTAKQNPFRPEFHGKQDLAHPYIPPAGPKTLLITPVTKANMPKQMDIRKTDRQDLVYGDPPRKLPSIPFPKIDRVKERLAAKNIQFSSDLYRKPKADYQRPPLKTTVAPANKPWYC